MKLRQFSVLGLLLVCVGCQHQAFQPINEFGRRVGDLVTGRTVEQDARRVYDQDFPDERRVGINRLVARDFGKRPPYTDQYKNLVRYDDSPLVRATAVRALNRSRDESATDLFISALSDTDPLVRLEAAKALGNVPSEAAAPRLLEVVRNPRENIDVRIAAVDALRHYRSIDVARTLAGLLQDRQFSLAWQARRSLVAMTGTDLHYDEGAWLEYLGSAAFRQA